MSWAGLQGTDVASLDSPAESSRFGLTIARLVVGAGAAPDHGLQERLTAGLREAQADLVVARWPGQHTGLAAAAARSGRVILPADMLLYWETPAATLAALTVPETTLETEAGGTGADVTDAVTEVVTDSFRGYGNHYSSNPLLDQDLALAGYVEWALGAVAASPENLVVLRDGGAAIGLATLTRAGADLEIELAGIVQRSQGRGAYPHLLRAVGAHAVRLGCERVIISTQAHNVRVQRGWTRAGFKPFASVQTVHAVSRPLWESSLPPDH